MSCVLLSVTHTGTFFVKRFLTYLSLDVRIGVGDKSIGYTDNPELVDVVQVHTNPRAFEQYRREGYVLEDVFKKAIIPLRHPHKAMISHVSDGGSLKDFRFDWECMLAEQPKYECCFFPIGGPPEERESLLNRVADFCGKSGDFHDYDWTPVNKSTGDKEPLTQAEVDGLEFAVEWYERWK